jgi:hypothetical protein
MDSLLLDARIGEYSFSEYVSEFGYEEVLLETESGIEDWGYDQETTETYEACVQCGRALESLFGKELYDALMWDTNTDWRS